MKLTQKQRILNRLSEGPAYNYELNRIAFRYSARIAQLRGEGHDIRWKSIKGKPGVTQYWLESKAVAA